MKLIKIFMILIVIFGVYYFGFSMKVNNNLGATVFEPGFDFDIIDKMPAYLFREDLSSRPYKINYNGNTGYMTVSKSNDSVSTILDFYEKQYPPNELIKLKAYFVKELKTKDVKKDKQLIRLINTINAFLDVHIQKPHFRWENKRFGVLGIFQFSKSPSGIDLTTFIQKYKQAIETGDFGKIATIRAVTVIKNAHVSIVLNQWTTSDFNIQNIIGNPAPDTLNDLNIPNHPKSKILLSMEQENTQTIDRIKLIKWNLSEDEIVEYFHSHLFQNGWVEISGPNQFNQMFNVSLQFKRDGRELLIWIVKNKQHNNFLMTLIDREKINN